MILTLLIVVAVIQVLPQVDLPDTAFHENTAPIVTKSRAIQVPTFDLLLKITVPLCAPEVVAFISDCLIATHPHTKPLPILLSTLLC
jgi:hypothetical protein